MVQQLKFSKLNFVFTTELHGLGSFPGDQDVTFDYDGICNTPKFDPSARALLSTTLPLAVISHGPCLGVNN